MEKIEITFEKENNFNFLQEILVSSILYGSFALLREEDGDYMFTWDYREICLKEMLLIQFVASCVLNDRVSNIPLVMRIFPVYIPSY